MQITSFSTQPSIGAVYLVGAGPGDAELLTLKAYRLMQQADVILYDYLVSEDIRALFPATSEAVYVGKKCGEHSMNQAQICECISHHALQGKQVVRLKGGDPSIFARVAEEIAHLTELNIPFAIVPGITAASGCAAYSGIPLTHRECAHGVRFVTAHFKHEDMQAQWTELALGQDTIVFYMGSTRLHDIASQLIKHGKAPSTPIAIIEQGTSDLQKTHIHTLAGIAALNEANNHYTLTGPALIIIGEVVNYRTIIDTALLQAPTQAPIRKAQQRQYMSA